jgi:hypothetical protein
VTFIDGSQGCLAIAVPQMVVRARAMLQRGGQQLVAVRGHGTGRNLRFHR